MTINEQEIQDLELLLLAKRLAASGNHLNYIAQLESELVLIKQTSDYLEKRRRSISRELAMITPSRKSTYICSSFVNDAFREVDVADIFKMVRD